jgi:hypothetical protein
MTLGARAGPKRGPALRRGGPHGGERVQIGFVFERHPAHVSGATKLIPRTARRAPRGRSSRWRPSQTAARTGVQQTQRTRTRPDSGATGA